MHKYEIVFFKKWIRSSTDAKLQSTKPFTQRKQRTAIRFTKFVPSMFSHWMVTITITTAQQYHRHRIMVPLSLTLNHWSRTTMMMWATSTSTKSDPLIPDHPKNWTHRRPMKSCVRALMPRYWNNFTQKLIVNIGSHGTCVPCVYQFH